MGSFGPMELVLIFLLVLLLFGAKKIPEIARGLGKGIREFKDATTDIKRELDVDEPRTPPRHLEAPPAVPPLHQPYPRADSPAQRPYPEAHTESRVVPPADVSEEPRPPQG
jgi:sec-independent protein translocase protein TatA